MIKSFYLLKKYNCQFYTYWITPFVKVGWLNSWVFKSTRKHFKISAPTKALNSGQQTGFSQVLFKRDASTAQGLAMSPPCPPSQCPPNVPPFHQPPSFLSHVRYAGGYGSAFKVAQMPQHFMTRLTHVFVSTKPDKEDSYCMCMMFFTHCITQKNVFFLHVLSKNLKIPCLS